MPRCKPTYKWPFTEGAPLEAEQHSHRMKGKEKGKKYKTDTPPRSVTAAGRIESVLNDSRYLLHYSAEKALGEALRRLEC